MTLIHIDEIFDELRDRISIFLQKGRYNSIVLTKIEEAEMFFLKGVSLQEKRNDPPPNQEDKV